MFRKIGTVVCLALICGMVGSAVIAKPRQPALAVGWHDEMNDLSTWQPLGSKNDPDIFSTRQGAMTLRLPHVPDGYPYTYQWGGVTRQATVDLNRYPVLVAAVSRVQDGSYAHLDVEERNFAGQTSRSLRTPTLQSRGLSILDVGKVWGTDTRRFHLRLIVGGALSGASCDYAWVRFVRREDVPGLQARWSGQHVVLEP